MSLKFTKGFTLIELLVVISIIGLLSSVVLAALGTSRDKAKNSKIQQELAQMKNAFELIRNSDGTYPFRPRFNPGTGTYSISLSAIDSNVLNIYNDLRSTNSNQSVVSYANADPMTKYSIYSALMPNNTTYWCVDSEGNHTTGQASALNDSSLTGGGYCR